MNDETLLPCPFCGSDNISDGEVLIEREDGTTAKQSECQNCFALGPQAVVDGPDYGDVEAIKAWNTRAQASAPDDEEFEELFGGLLDALWSVSERTDILIPEDGWNKRDWSGKELYERALEVHKGFCAYTLAQSSAPEGAEAIAWESTTPAYFKYITQSKYDKISDASKQWYKPYRCSDCTNAPEGGVVACKECGGAGVYPKIAMLPAPPDVTCRKCHGSGRDFTRSNAKAGEVWLPIDSAPKRGFASATIDLWIDNGDAGYREADCWWDIHGDCWRNADGRLYYTGGQATHWMEVEPPTHDKTKA